MNDPAINSQWPPYMIGPRDSIFALGVVSVKYARLEFAMSTMFATLNGITADHASLLVAKLTNEIRVKIMREMLAEKSWPENIIALVNHFIDAYKILADNRNLLMHSNIIAGIEDQIALYKSNRAGHTILCQVTLEELRGIADDMHTYFGFGLGLSNRIQLEVLNTDPLHFNLVLNAAWPDKPPLPIPLEYAPELRPARGRRGP